VSDGLSRPRVRALLPNGTATFANYSSYIRGLNGVMGLLSRDGATESGW